MISIVKSVFATAPNCNPSVAITDPISYTKYCVDIDSHILRSWSGLIVLFLSILILILIKKIITKKLKSLIVITIIMLIIFILSVSILINSQIDINQEVIRGKKIGDCLQKAKTKIEKDSCFGPQ